MAILRANTAPRPPFSSLETLSPEPPALLLDFKDQLEVPHCSGARVKVWAVMSRVCLLRLVRGISHQRDEKQEDV